MHATLTSFGRGSCQRAIDYLFAPKDSKGVERSAIRILRGDPQMVAKIADSLDFAWRYSSGSLGFNRFEELDEATLQEICTDFERVILGGLSPDRNCWCMVQHIRPEPQGGWDIHFVHARVDLLTGRSVNYFPPGGWKKLLANWELGWCHRLGLARVDDPRRAKNVQPAKHETFISAAELRAGLPAAVATQREKISAWIAAGVREGFLADRESVLAAMQRLASHQGGAITRVGSDHISVRLQPGSRPIRLKSSQAGLFHEDLNAANWLTADRERAAGGSAGVSGRPGLDAEIGTSGRGGDVNLERARFHRQAALDLAAARRRFFEKRFGPGGQPQPEPEVTVASGEHHGDADRAASPGSRGAGRPPAQDHGDDAGRQPGGRPVDHQASTGSPPAQEGAPRRDLFHRGFGGDRASENPPAALESAALGRADADRGDGAALHSRRDRDLGLDPGTDRPGRRRGDGGERAAPADPEPHRVDRRKRKAPPVTPPSVVDQFLAMAQARATRAAQAIRQPQEPTMKTEAPTALPASSAPSLSEALLNPPSPPMPRSAVASAAGAGTTGAGADLSRPAAPDIGTSGELLAPVFGDLDANSNWIARFLSWIKNWFARLFGVATQPAPPGLALPDAPDERELLIAELRQALAQVRSELAALRARAAAQGFDLSNVTLAEDAAVKGLEAGALALQLDRERDQARAARELRALRAADGDRATEVAKIEAAASAVATAREGQILLDAEEERARRWASGKSELDSRDPQQAQLLREEWLTLSRRIRAGQEQEISNFKRPLETLSQAEISALPRDIDARVAALRAHREAQLESRRLLADQIASWAGARRAIEAQLWPENELDAADGEILHG